MARDRKVRKGERFRGRVTAEAWNSFVDAARHFRTQQRTLVAPRDFWLPQSSLFPVRNDSGAALDRFGVVGVTAPLVLPSANLLEFQNQIALAADAPATGDARRFAVLQEPLEPDRIGLAAFAGLSVCQINAATSEAASWGYARAEAGDAAQLWTDATQGGAQILWRAGGTGPQWGLVRLGVAGSDIVFKIGVLDDDLLYGATATLSVYTGAQLAETDSGEDLTISAPWLAPGDVVPAGSWGAAAFNGWAWYLIVAQCPDPSGSS